MLKRRRIAAHCAVLMLAFLLAFSSFPMFALADEIVAEGSSEPDITVPVDPGDGGGEEQPVDPDPGPGPATPTVRDVGIFYHETNRALGYASNPNVEQGEIRSKGGTLQFDNVLYWTDGSNEGNSTYVEWSVDDESVATINVAGILTAKDDGMVLVKATVKSSDIKTYNDEDLVASCVVRVIGQTDAPYVTGLTILDKEQNPTGSAAFILKQDLSTAMAQFYALVDVYDPVTGQTTTYNTANGLISEQTNKAVADPTWLVADSAMGYADETGGMFRPYRFGITFLLLISNAGLGNEQLSARVIINTQDPEGGEVRDGYFPQDTLTVKAYYEQQGITNPKAAKESDFVINETYSMVDLANMGMETQTYTALGSGSYYTITGRGVALSKVLSNAGVNLDGVDQIAFGTADNIDRPVSYNWIFGKNRYYFPNIDINNYSEAQQVYPMLAFSSVEVKNGSTEPDYAMTEATRFRLLFGSTAEGGTSQYQIKWINTLYVQLSGGPHVEDDKNTEEDPDAGDDGTGGGDLIQGGDGLGGGTGSEADAPGLGQAGEGASAGVQANVSGGVNEMSDAQTHSEEGASSASAGEAAQKAAAKRGEKGGQYEVYQVMNINDSDTPLSIEYENPFKRFTGPLGIGVIAAGGGEAFLWYRRQRKLTPGYLTGINAHA